MNGMSLLWNNVKCYSDGTTPTSIIIRELLKHLIMPVTGFQRMTMQLTVQDTIDNFGNPSVDFELF
jgi:hypothetical protein